MDLSKSERKFIESARKTTERGLTAKRRAALICCLGGLIGCALIAGSDVADLMSGADLSSEHRRTIGFAGIVAMTFLLQAAYVRSHCDALSLIRKLVPTSTAGEKPQLP